MKTKCVSAVLALAAVLLKTSLLIADERPIYLKDDTKLQAKIDLKIACEPLSFFADTLTKSAGIPIRVRRDIADQNVAAFAHDIHAYEAMNRVAQIFGYDWQITGDPAGKHSYTLSQSLRRKRQADELRQADAEKTERSFRDAIEEGIGLVDADPDTRNKALKKNPVQLARYLGFQNTLRDLGCFAREQRDGIWERMASSPLGEVRIPFTELPASLQQRLRDRVDQNHATSPQYPSSEGIEKQYLVISRSGSHLMGMPLDPNLGFFGMPKYGGIAGLGFVGDDARPTDEDLEFLDKCGVNTGSYNPPSPEFADAQSKSKRVPIKFEDSGKPDDKKANADSTAIPVVHSFEQILEAASRMFGISVFADAYLCRDRNAWSARTTFPDNPDEAIAEIGREFGYDVAGSSHTDLRCKTWYLEEARDVPKRLLLRWAALKKKQGHLEFKDYVDMTRELSNTQLQGLISARLDGEHLLMEEAANVGDNADRLRLCSMLTTVQMNAAYGTGLPYGAMSAQQQQLCAYLLCNAKHSITVEELSRCLFIVRQETSTHQGSGKDQDKAETVEQRTVTFSYVLGPQEERRFGMWIDRGHVIEGTLSHGAADSIVSK